MSTPPVIDGPVATLEASTAGDIGNYERVYVNSSGLVARAGAGDKSLGVVWKSTVDVSETARASVRFNNLGGTTTMVAAGAVTAGADVFAAADGRVAATGQVFEGKALNAASAAGEYLEVIPAEQIGAASQPIRHLLSAAEAEADSVTIDTGLGAALDDVIVQIFDAATGAPIAVATRVLGSGGTAGQVTVTTTADTTAENDVVVLIPIVRAVDGA